MLIRVSRRLGWYPIRDYKPLEIARQLNQCLKGLMLLRRSIHIGVVLNTLYEIAREVGLDLIYFIGVHLLLPNPLAFRLIHTMVLLKVL